MERPPVCRPGAGRTRRGADFTRHRSGSIDRAGHVPVPHHPVHAAAGRPVDLSQSFVCRTAGPLACPPTRSFAGRRWLINLFAVPLGLPPLVAALGLIEIWGRNGIANRGLSVLGIETPFSIYGLSGILIAHVFFNMPLAVRLILPALERLPGEYWKTAANLGMNGLPCSACRMARDAPFSRGCGRHLVFMLCATSFTLVLVLGGGPAATTLEVAIYQALRFDFNPGRAVLLSFIQVGLTLMVMLVLRLFSVPTEEGQTSGGRTESSGCPRWTACAARRCPDRPGTRFCRRADACGSGVRIERRPARLVGDALFWRATVTSLSIGIAAATISVLMASLLVRGRYSAGSRPGSPILTVLAGLSGAAGSLTLLVPPVVLGAGWFLMFGGTTGQLLAPLAVIVLVNALMALPFVMRVVEPAHRNTMERNGRLSRVSRSCRPQPPATDRHSGNAAGTGDRLRLRRSPVTGRSGGDRALRQRPHHHPALAALSETW
jgi:thiamine transport system permease protein